MYMGIKCIHFACLIFLGFTTNLHVMCSRSWKDGGKQLAGGLPMYMKYSVLIHWDSHHLSGQQFSSILYVPYSLTPWHNRQNEGDQFWWCLHNLLNACHLYLRKNCLDYQSLTIIIGGTISAVNTSTKWPSKIVAMIVWKVRTVAVVVLLWSISNTHTSRHQWLTRSSYCIQCLTTILQSQNKMT